MQAKSKKIIKWVAISLAIVACIVALPFVALRIALTDSVANKILQIVPDYLKAEVSVGHIDYKLLSSWPEIELGLDDVYVTSTVFTPKDTLLHVDSLRACVNAGIFLKHGAIAVKKLKIDNPYIYVKRDSGNFNFMVFADDTTAVDTTVQESEFVLPDIYVRGVSLNNGKLRFDDVQGQQNILAEKINFEVPRAKYKFDSIMGRLSFAIDTVIYDDYANAATYTIGDFAIDAKAAQIGPNVYTDVTAGTPSVNLNDSTFHINDKAFNLYLRGKADTTFHDIEIVKLTAAIDSLSLEAQGKLKGMGNRTLYTDLSANLRLPEINDLFALVPESMNESLKGLKVSGSINLDATSKGLLRKKDLPTLTAKLSVENLKAKYSQFPEGLDDLQLEVSAVYNDNYKDSTVVSIDKLYARNGKTQLSANGKYGSEGGREYVDLKLNTHLNLHTVNNIYRIEPNASMSGFLDADIKANFFLDDIVKDKDFYKIYTTSRITGDDVRVNLPEMKVNLFVDSLRARLNTNTEVKNRRRSDTSLVNTRLSFRAMDLNYADQIKAKADRFNISFLADDLDSAKVPRLRASVTLRGLDANVRDTMRIYSKKARASINVRKDSVYYFLPRSTASITLDSIIMSDTEMGAMLKESKIKVSVLPRFRRNRRDSTGKRVRIPFNEQPVVDLKSLTQLFDTIGNSDDPAELFLKKFKADGNINVRRFRAKNPASPIRVALNRVNVDFTDDTLHLKNFVLRYGRSRIKLTGDVNNIRRYLLRGRTLSADLSLTSKRIDLNQILRSFYMVEQFRDSVGNNQQALADSVNANMEDLAMDMDDEQEEAYSDELIDSTAQASLVVLPKNLDIKFNADIDTVFLGRMQLRDFQGGVTLKNSAVRLKQFSTSTQLGNAGLNVMYECKDSTQANVALSLEMDSVQVGDIVHYFPELDSILPMLRSFSGSVACEAAASAKLDSTMGINLPSVNAGLWLRGDSLTLMDGETFSEIAKMLMFSKKTKNRIDSVSVELLVRNNEIEIYPFMVGMDKYRLGVGGTQGLNGEFNYHIVLLKSPLLFRIGLDVYGKDFDNIKFRLASPKFKNSTVQIGKGGTLINTSTVNLRQTFHDAMVKTILETQ